MAYTDSEDLNYRGELFRIGNYRTPFMAMMGGMGAGARSNSFAFPVAQPWSLSSASQPAIDEATASAAGTAGTVTRAEDTNTAQIFKEDVSVSFMKQSQTGALSGINTNHANPVLDELGFQKMAALNQMAIDMEFTFLNGAYVAAANANTAAKSRGIVTASAAGTNTVDASAAALSKALIDELLRDMAANGAIFQNTILFVNALQKQKLSDIYGYAPTDRNVGGLNIQQIETDFAQLGVVYDPFMDTDELLIAEMSVCRPVFVPVSFNGEDFAVDMEGGSDVLWVPTAITAAQKGGFWYTQVGLDYGPEEYHGTLTNLATS